MKLNIDYTGSKQGFDLDILLDATIDQDAEALGYIANVLFESALRLSELLKTSNPKYHERINRGIQRSIQEKSFEKNPHYPFTTWIIQDEPS